MLGKIQRKESRICILGMGYIGLPTSIVFAKAGFSVYGFDVNKEVINTLKSGKIHIVEPDLQDAFEETLNSGNLIPVFDIPVSDIYIICVPTPFKKNEEKKMADLSYIESASKIVSKVIKKGDLVVLESTVPPRTTEDVMGRIIEEESSLKINEDFKVAHCPERVLPGKILFELENNTRVIGVSDEEAGEIAKKLYASFLEEDKIFITDTITAEMCKLVENTSRDIQIAFANELSVICDKLGIDVFELIKLANKHPRVDILNPGAGVGGHCLAVDPWFIVEKFPDEAKLINQARLMNDYKPEWIVRKVEEDLICNFNGSEKQITIGVLGLAYKPNIDDLRESPSLKIALSLKNKGYNVIGCEPNSKVENIKGIENMDIKEIIEKSDYLVYALNHAIFNEYLGEISKKLHFDPVGVIEINKKMELV